MAEAWGVPPWEIMAAPGGLRWAGRFKVYREELRAAQERAKK